MVPHHFGMFKFNTADTAELKPEIADTAVPRCVLPDVDNDYRLTAGKSLDNRRPVGKLLPA